MQGQIIELHVWLGSGPETLVQVVLFFIFLVQVLDHDMSVPLSV